jgi:hypothetical protein
VGVNFRVWFQYTGRGEPREMLASESVLTYKISIVGPGCIIFSYDPKTR